jgi:transcriptional regulator with XRE-family HTH domain
MEEINRLFAKRLQELRRLNNVKQEHIARALNMTQQNYSLLERGQRNFTLKHIQQICDFYKIPVTEFLNLGNQSTFTNSPLSNNSHNSSGFNNRPK